MPSDHKKRKAQKSKASKTKKPGQECTGKENEENQACAEPTKNLAECCNFDNDDEFVGSADEDEQRHRTLCNELESLNLLSEAVASNRSVTGVLASHKESKDLHVISLSITFHGQELLVDTELKLNNKNRYGLLGLNGCGKSTLLAVMANREIPIPGHIDIFLLQREMSPSDKTALQSVLDVDQERVRLEDELEYLAGRVADNESLMDRMMEVQERLDVLDSDKSEKRAAELLFGLGFTKEMQRKQVKHFSGGWRMRIALARALFLQPSLLLLDEPTNHLDLSACVWLENELKNYPRCLVIVSHSQDFLNGVCTRIVNMRTKKLTYYSGNFDTYVQTRCEQEEFQSRQFDKQKREMDEIKDFVARFGHGTKKLARQAQSRQKLLDRRIQDGLVQAVQKDKLYAFSFPDPGHIPPPVIQVRGMSFRYHKDKPLIYENLDLGIDLDTRVALVGPNGAGKSTLLKLISKELDPTDGVIQRHSHVRIGRYHQHLHEILDLESSALEWMRERFPEVKEVADMRKILGRYGLSGPQQVCKIRTLSDGQRCRIIFAYIAQQAPHLLLMDEPTNHLDIETIDALADAINDFSGGLLLVSHDFRLINQVADELWVCDNRTVTVWEGDIFKYKQQLKKQLDENMSILVER